MEWVADGPELGYNGGQVIFKILIPSWLSDALAHVFNEIDDGEA